MSLILLFGKVFHGDIMIHAKKSENYSGGLNFCVLVKLWEILAGTPSVLW